MSSAATKRGGGHAQQRNKQQKRHRDDKNQQDNADMQMSDDDVADRIDDGRAGASTSSSSSSSSSAPVWSALDVRATRARLCDRRQDFKDASNAAATTQPASTSSVIVPAASPSPSPSSSSPSPFRCDLLTREGDSVIVYESRIALTPLVLERGKTFGNRFGTFHHADLIGIPYGSRVRARGKGSNQGWVVLLPFASDLWTNALRHRTQILYLADIAFTLFMLDLKPGDVVFESGTGSGSLTTALATAIRPHGHVHTFEFNAERVKKAREDFSNNHLSDFITVRERDVCRDGFPLVEGGANAVFLDLPSPWTVIPSAKAALLHQGRLCSFSPCIEQVQRTCLELDRQGFEEIVTIEILLRSFEVQAHTTLPIANAQRLQQKTQKMHDERRNKWEKKQQQQYQKKSMDGGESEQSKKRTASAVADGQDEPENGAAKKMKTETGASPARDASAASSDPTSSPSDSPTPSGTSNTCQAPVQSSPSPSTEPAPTAVTYVTTRPYQLMRGHTGYLTFAVCNKF